MIRLCSFLLGAVLFVAGCAGEEPAVPSKSVPVVIKVMNEQRQPLAHAGVSYAKIIPEHLKKEVGAIPWAVQTDGQGQVKLELSPGKYEFRAGSAQKIVEVKDHPVTVELIEKE